MQIIDKRNQVIPGGVTVQKLIGTTPLVVKHLGQYVDGSVDGSWQAARDFDVDDSFNDMSIAVGDVSVQVVQNSKQ